MPTNTRTPIRNDNRNPGPMTLPTPGTPAPKGMGPQHVAGRTDAPQMWISNTTRAALPFGQDPRRVAQAYKLLKATPKDMSLPSWMVGQERAIEQAYQWYNLRNNGAPDTEWKFLPPDDPGFEWINSIRGPEPTPTSAPHRRDIGKDPAAYQQTMVQRGQASWNELAPEERQRLLADPNFDIAKYDPAIRTEILNDPNFDWSRVPKWQKTYWEIMSNPKIMASPMALAGARVGRIAGPLGIAAGAAGGYALGLVGGQAYDPTLGVTEQPTTAAAMMAVLNKLSEGAEQAIGYGAQLEEASEGFFRSPEQREKVAELLLDPDARRAAWEAGRILYEVDDTLGQRNWAPGIALLFELGNTTGWANKEVREQIIKDAGIQFADPGQDFIVGRAAPVERSKIVTAINPVTGNKYDLTDSYSILNEARQTIHQAIIKGATEEEIDGIIRTMLGDQAQYVGASISDFAGQMIIDPLEVLPNVTNATTSKLAKLMGNETAARAFAETNAPFEAARRYQTLVQAGDVPASFDYSRMSSISRWVAGINREGAITAGPLTRTGLLDPAAKRQGLWTKLKEDWSALTPEARAREGASMFYRNIGTMLQTFADPHEIGRWMRTLSNGDMALWKEMAGKAAGSPEWYTILPALKAFKAETLDGLLASWDLTTEKRTRMLRIAEILGEEPGKLIEDLAKRGTPEQDLARVTERARQAGAEGADLLRDIEAGTITAAHLKDIVDAFTGPGAQHWHPDQWKASLMDAMGKHFDEWTVEKLQLGKDTPEAKAFFRTAHLLKSAQSVLLLGGSPGYALQNGLSGMVHRAATGVYGYMTEKQIDAWLDRFGIRPPRLEEGVGIGGMVEQATTRGNVQTQAIESAIRGSGGALSRAQRAVSAIGKAMPFNKLSSWFEKTEGKNAYMIAMKDMWSRTWRRGVGFQEMPAQLKRHIQNARINPDQIYNLIEAGMNQAEIERFIFGRQTGIMSRTLVNEAAQKTGMNATDAATMLEKVGVLDALDQALKRASTPDRVRNAFRQAAQHASEYKDMQTARDLKVMAEHAANVANTEGAPAALDVVQRAHSAYMDAWMEHYYRLGEIFADVLEVPDPALKSRAIEEAYSISEREFRRINARSAANYRGIFDAWGKSQDPQAMAMLAAIADSDQAMAQAYRFMREQRRAFFDKYNPNNPDNGSLAAQAEWSDLQAQIDAEFGRAFERKKANEIRQAESLTAIYTELYGPAAGEAARRWWLKVIKFSDEIVMREKRFRASVATMPKEQRAAAKQQFYGTDKIAQIAELERIHQEGIQRLERVIRKGRGGGPAATGGPAAPRPGGPPAPATPDDLVAGLRDDYTQNIQARQAQANQETIARLQEQGAQRRLTPAEEKELKRQQELEEINQLAAEAEQRARQEQVENSTRAAQAMEIAAEYGITSSIHLQNALRRPEYGGRPEYYRLSNPDLTPETVRAILEKRKELKLEEQIQVTARAVERQKRGIKKASPFLQTIENIGGIDRSLIAEFGGDRVRGYPRLFTEPRFDGGHQLDQLITRLQEQGYRIDVDNPDDVGGINQVTEMIREAMAGNEPRPIDYVESDAAINRAEAEWAEQQMADLASTTTGDDAAGRFDLEEAERQFHAAADAQDLDTVYEIASTITEQAGDQLRPNGESWNDYISRTIDDIVDQQIKQDQIQTIANRMADADLAERNAEIAAEKAMTKQMMREKLLEEVGLPEAQVDAYMEISEAVAAWYGAATGEDPAAFYSRYYQDVRRATSIEDMLHQDHAAPIWHSKAEQTVLGFKQENMTVDQLRGQLKSAGIKAEELKWLGIEELLADRTGKITRTEVLETIQANQIRIHEVVRGGKVSLSAEQVMDATWKRLAEDQGWKMFVADMRRSGFEFDAVEMDGELTMGWHKRDGDIIATDELPSRLRNQAETMEEIFRTTFDFENTQVTGDETAPARYEGYIAPGEYDNYREILLTLPGKQPDQLPPDAHVLQFGKDDWRVHAADRRTLLGSGDTEMEARINAIQNLRPEVKYRSGHWTEPNILAHTRLSDRVDADGKRVLYVEEIQSDWHQAGRKKGYKDPNADAKLQALEKEQLQLKRALDEEDTRDERRRIQPATVAWSEMMDGFTEQYGEAGWFYKLTDEQRAAYDAVEEAATKERSEGYLRLQQIESEKVQLTKGVEPAPFEKTWHELVMKRILRMAAEDGYDRIAWTTGEQQAARYNLAKHVDGIRSVKNDDGTYFIEGTKDRQQVLAMNNLTPEKLEEIIGKDLTKKIVDHPDTEGTWTGVDLQVGGEGMKGFYDRMLPAWVDKYTKKWGAKSREITIGSEQAPNPRRYLLVQNDGQPIRDPQTGDILTFEDINEARRMADERAGQFPGADVRSMMDTSRPETFKSHGIDMTPELRKAMLESQALFQQPQPINRRMNAQEISDYAYALNRAGFDELRRAVEGESSKATRRKILDEVHKLNPVLAESVARRTANILFQGTTDPKGGVTFDGIKATIHAFNRADISTVIHENAHVYRRMIADVVERTQDPRIAEDLRTLEEWAGARDGVWDRGAEEKFARGFERYITEGQAPTPKIARAFERMRQWMLGIYKVLRGTEIDVQITPQVKAIFDKMLSTEAPPPTAMRTIVDAPRAEADYLPMKDWWNAQIAPYKEGASSRTTPNESIPYKPGQWFIDDTKGVYGRQIEHLTVMKVADLELSEEDWTQPINYEGRGDDARRYAQWIQEGKTNIPPLRVIQHEGGGFRIIDGHRRIAAAKMAGLEDVPVLVSYNMDTGKRSYDGKPIYTGLTYEGMLQGAEAASRQWDAAQQALLTPKAPEPDYMAMVRGKDTVERRLQTHEQLRNAWDKFDEQQRSEVLEWILRKTMTDPLSGLETLVAMSIDGEKPAGWVEATSDLNALTAINNNFGHTAGDEIIKEIGRIAKEEVALAGGRAFRVGGDEFTYWFPNQAAAERALQAIDTRVSSETFVIAGKKRTGFSISYGIGETHQLADQALYADKARRIATGQRPEVRDQMPSTLRALEQRGQAQTWYHKSEATITAIKQETMTVDQLRGALTKAGVKADEMKWTGLDELLASRTGKITKAEVLEHLAANRVEIKEVTRGGDVDEYSLVEAVYDIEQTDEIFQRDAAEIEQWGYEYGIDYENPSQLQFLADGNTILPQQMPAGAREHAQSMNLRHNNLFRNQQVKAGGAPTRYEQYKLPGGENYREILFTLPAKELPAAPTRSLLDIAGEVSERIDRSPISSHYVNALNELGYTYEPDFDDPRHLVFYDAAGQEVDWQNHPDIKVRKTARNIRDTWGDEWNEVVKQSMPPEQTRFQSSHWSEKDVLAHTRLTDRTDVDGKRVLFVEEIQSDWHQAGRKQGYKGAPVEIPESTVEKSPYGEDNWEIHNPQARPGTGLSAVVNKINTRRGAQPTGMRSLPTEFIEDIDNIFVDSEPNGSVYYIAKKEGEQTIWTGAFFTEEQAQHQIDYWRQYYKPETYSPGYEAQFRDQKKTFKTRDEAIEWAKQTQRDHLKKVAQQSTQGVEPAPFEKTWHELVMKRVLRMAAEGNYDRVAWTTGQQQAKRYNLAQQIEWLDYWTEDGGENYVLQAKPRGRSIQDLNGGERIPAAKLSEFVGDEVAKKIVAREGDPLEGEASLDDSSIRRLAGEENLVVGGEGMKGFYDRMLPSWANKYAKKWGAQVGETKVATADMPDPALEGWATDNPDIQIIFDDDTGLWYGIRQFDGDPENIQPITDGEDTAAASAAAAGVKIVRSNALAPVHSIDVTPEMRRSVMEGQPLFQRAEPHPDQKLIDHINKKDWWRTEPPSAEAIEERGLFYASSFEEAEFYGRPVDTPFHPQINRPLVGDEKAIMEKLNLPMPEGEMSIEARFALDAAMKQAAAAQGYDSIVLMTPRGYKSYAKTGKTPKSIELNVFPRNDTLLRTATPEQGLKQLSFLDDIEPAPREDTPAFERWFGNSQVVDPQGRPLVVYHGTINDFQTFKLSSKSHGVKAAYFTDSPGTAENYAALGTLDTEPNWRDTPEKGGLYAVDGTPRIMPVYLKMENPLIIDEAKEPVGWKEMGPLMKKAKAAGHDGIISRNALDDQGMRFGEKGVEFLPIDEEAGANPTNIYIVFDARQIKSVGNRGTYDPKNPNILFQTDQPTGTMDDAASHRADSEWMEQGWQQFVGPLLGAMEETAINKLTNERPLDGAMKDVSPEGQKMLRDYIRKVQQDMSAVKNSTMKWGESQRDFALLNYNRRYGFDRYLDVVAPYQFFYTRSLMTWAMRGLDKPSWYAKYARLRNMQNKHERDIPERLRNKTKINAPWLPDWMGDALYIDPMQSLFTPAGFMRPIETMRRDKNYQVIETERILQEWTQDGTTDEAEAAEAAQTQSGPLWERAAAEAGIRREQEISNPFDFMATMFGPAWYLSAPLNLMGIEVPGISKGDPAKVGNLPLTNTARAAETVTKGTWAEPIGQFIGLAGKPEEWIREKAKLPEFGEYGDYYIDRQLSNMVAEGLIDSDQAQLAMIERSGPTFDQAKHRVKMELALRVPLAATTYAATHEGAVAGAQAFIPSLFGSGLLPQGELEYRGLKEEWNHAWKLADQGDKEAVSNFLDEHPEYEAYLAKGKKPEEKLRSFLIGNIWDAYMALGETNKKQARAQMGDEFATSFLNKETRSYETLDIQTLTTWARMLGAQTPAAPPQTAVGTTPPSTAVAAAPTLDLYDPQTTQITDKFFQERKEKWTDYHMLEQGYYSQPKSQRAEYLLKFPRLKEYWNWKDGYFDKYPELVPIFKGQAFKQVDTTSWPSGLEQYVVTYAITGKKLPKGAQSALQQIWIREGRPMDDFDAWLNSQVVPAMLYQPGGQQPPMQIPQ